MALHQPQRRFDFDHWVTLARDDPAGFETARRRYLEALIDSAEPEARRRLRGLQFRIDMERRRAPNPLAACIRIQSLMWDSVLGPDGLCERVCSLGDLGRLRPVAKELTPRCATIIPFPRPPRS